MKVEICLEWDSNIFNWVSSKIGIKVSYPSEFCKFIDIWQGYWKEKGYIIQKTQDSYDISLKDLDKNISTIYELIKTILKIYKPEVIEEFILIVSKNDYINQEIELIKNELEANDVVVYEDNKYHFFTGDNIILLFSFAFAIIEEIVEHYTESETIILKEIKHDLGIDIMKRQNRDKK